MKTIYAAIGKFVVDFVRRRYRNEIRAAAAVSIAAIAIGAYIATRDREEET